MQSVKVYYEHPEKIADGFEKQLDALMQAHGLKRWASGWDYCDSVRDIAYEKPTTRKDED